jgi:hypothetical protein
MMDLDEKGAMATLRGKLRIMDGFTLLYLRNPNELLILLVANLENSPVIDVSPGYTFLFWIPSFVQ